MIFNRSTPFVIILIIYLLPAWITVIASGYSSQRIVGGKRVNISDHPYQLSLLFNGRHCCGASIIDENWAVTASHCLHSDTTDQDNLHYHNPEFFTLNAGSYRLSSGLEHEVDRIVPHELYNPDSLDYDIALLKVKNVFRFGWNIRPVKLPPAGWYARTNSKANVTGWGLVNEDHDESRVTKFLRMATVSIVSPGLCHEVYRDITTRMLCAGDFQQGGLDSCQGDSGGPLVSQGILVGLVSWGEGCGRPGHPGVYTKVSQLREWILNNTKFRPT